jgi:hypothetical protein
MFKIEELSIRPSFKRIIYTSSRYIICLFF